MDLPALDARSIKARLPIVYVLDRFSIPVEDVGGQYAGVCPFHPDSDPSLDVYGNALERWGCFACGAGGDVFDLIERLAWKDQAPPFREVRAYALVLLGELEASDWTGPTTGIARTFDPAKARLEVASSSLNSLASVERFLTIKHANGQLLGLDAAHLNRVWGVGSRENEIIIPYWSRGGDLVSYKHRTAFTKALSPAGKGQFEGVLYGEWQDMDPARPVLLVEGESDAWAAHGAVADLFTVLALPTGAGAHPRQAATLAGRDVALAFDGDVAGLAAVLRWRDALEAVGASHRHYAVPMDTDLAAMAPADLRALLSR